MAPRMRPTGNLHQSALRVGEKAVVRHIGIGLQIAPIIFEKFLGSSALPRCSVIEDDARMIHVSDIRPKSAFSGGPRQALIEHSHRRIVRAGYLRAQYEGFQSLIERTEQLRRLAHPSAHRLVRDVDAKPREDLSLAMQDR